MSTASWVRVTGFAIGYQFNRGSSGARDIRRTPTRCACGQKVIRFKGMVLEVARRWDFVRIEAYEVTDRHTCEKTKKEDEENG